MTVGPSDLEGLVNARVLIVEDEGIVAKDLERSLRSLGYRVCGVAGTGPDAVAKAVALRPELVLIDIRLRGEMDGIQAAERIREQFDVPVVFLTAYADPATLNRASAARPYGYVLKPFDDRELHATLIVALWRHRAFADLDVRVQERTKELARTAARYERLESVAELGIFALGTLDTEEVMRRAVTLVRATLGVEWVDIIEVQPDGAQLLLRAAEGWPPNLVGRIVENAEADAFARHAFASADSVVVGDFAAETRFRPPQLLVEHGVASAIAVVIHAPGANGTPYGLLRGHAQAVRRFSDDDVNFLRAVANVIAACIIRSLADARLREAERVAEQERVRAGLAEEAIRARDIFLSMASHELRTPVAALQLQLEVVHALLPAAGRDARVQQKLEGARATVTRLASLVERVLDVSRIALGKLELAKEPLDLAAVAHEVVVRHEELAAEAGCELHWNAPRVVLGRWDRVRIEQVIGNLISNALKFGAGKPVDVSVTAKGDDAVIAVRDRGEGIDPADSQRLLHRFERAASHRHYGGLGLGLYITRQIAEAHGGRVEVWSRPQEGAAVSVILPREHGTGTG